MSIIVIIDKYRTFFSSNRIPNNSLFLIGVSGGIDSMVTLDLSRKIGLNIAVAHVNYQLRGEESERDTKIVKTYCKKHSIRFHYTKANLNQVDNIQTAARDFRYHYFSEIIQENNIDFIITAHHQNDDHETFLLNAIRGSGLNGLKGIPEIRSNILRPALQFNKSQLKDYALKNKVPFGEDSSNATSKYDRNYLRNKVISSLLNRFPHMEKGLTNSIQSLKKDHQLLLYLIDKIITPYIVKKENAIVITPDKDIPNHCWYYFLKNYGFNYAQISNWIKKERQTGKFIVSTNFRLIKDRQTWILAPLQDPSSITYYLKENQSITNPIHLECSSIGNLMKIEKNEKIGYFTYEKLIFPLTIRKWRKGDKIHPLGMKGQKKVSDILIDNKISSLDKENIYVLISNNEIIWLIGICINEKYKVNRDNNSVYEVVLKS